MNGECAVSLILYKIHPCYVTVILFKDTYFSRLFYIDYVQDNFPPENLRTRHVISFRLGILIDYYYIYFEDFWCVCILIYT